MVNAFHIQWFGYYFQAMEHRQTRTKKHAIMTEMVH